MATLDIRDKLGTKIDRIVVSNCLVITDIYSTLHINISDVLDDDLSVLVEPKTIPDLVKALEKVLELNHKHPQ